jgi:hypothetical protein
MCAVALGHWIAADVRMVDGSLSGGNALDHVRGLHILTWVFQVMPVFFCIGGYSNAASLDAHHRAGKENASWVRARLLRLTTPSIWLAGTWLTVLAAGQLLGFGSLAEKAVAVAAIPLWFLANYVADTALSPITLRLYRAHGMRFVGVLLALFAVGEAARFPGIHFVPQINIVLGWLLFQMLGFAWKDGHLPTGASLVRFGMASWSMAGLLVAFGPYPLAMVSVPGARFANTWPPSLALMFYGFGLCAFAIAAAPRISALLSHNAKAWKIVVVANTMTMTSYLWHFTALSIAAVILSRFNLLPTAAVGSGTWWLQKLPVMGVALVVLAGLVLLLSPKERKGLLHADGPHLRSASSPARESFPTGKPDRGLVGASGEATIPSGILSAKQVAILTGVGGFALAAGFETWTAAEGTPLLAIPGMFAVLGVHFGLRLVNRHAA